MAGATHRALRDDEDTASLELRREILDALAVKVGPTVLAGQQVLPVSLACRELFPEGGLRRGSTVAVSSPALAFAVLAQASGAGSWICCVERVEASTLGWVSAAEYGVALDRVVVARVPAGGGASAAGSSAVGGGSAAVVSAALDAFDVVLVSGVVLAPRDARRLQHRARERNAVLMVVERAGLLDGLAVGADVRLEFSSQQWEGVEQGHGALERRLVKVSVQGRRAAGRSRDVAIWLPATTGVAAVVDSSAPVRSLVAR